MYSTQHAYLGSLLIFIAIVLIVAYLMVEIFHKIKCPGVVGELLTGIVLGPTLLGNFFPNVYQNFSNTHIMTLAEIIFSISAVIFLFTSGIEIQLKLYNRKNIKTAIFAAGVGGVAPFLGGFLIVVLLPSVSNTAGIFYLSLILGIILAISALPVIIRILNDTKILKTNTGAIIMASAMITDIICWLAFSTILDFKEVHQSNIIAGKFIALVGFLFFLVMANYLITKTVTILSDKKLNRDRILTLSLGVGFLSAGYADYIHMHATLGAFISGVMFGDLLKKHIEVKNIMEKFTYAFFSPIFFVSVGFKVNFIQNFDWFVTTVIICTACITKIVGAALGARLSGLSRHESLMVGYGLNPRGAMGIIFSTIALDTEIITPTIFVALVIMTLFTSMISGPMLNRLQHYQIQGRFENAVCVRANTPTKGK